MKMVISGIVAGVIAVLLLLLIFYSVNDEGSDKLPQAAVQEEAEKVNPYKNAELTIQIIPGGNNTFGYNILLKERILIHQPHAPGLPGVEGFKNEDEAKKVAEFVVAKIRNNIFPPSITVEELDSLRVF